MANLIGSLRLVSSFDWSEFFESVSLVEQVLQRDPAAVYARMDFVSRDRYRHAVEEMAEPTRRRPGARGAQERRTRPANRGAVARRAGGARRLLPDRRGPAAVRTGHRMGAGSGRPPQARLLQVRHHRLPRHHRAGHVGARRRRDRVCLLPGLAMADADGRRSADARAGERADDSDPSAPDCPIHSAAASAPARPRPHSGIGAHDGDHPDDSRQRATARGNLSRTSRCRRSAISIRTSTSPS